MQTAAKPPKRAKIRRKSPKIDQKLEKTAKIDGFLLVITRKMMIYEYFTSVFEKLRIFLKTLKILR